MQVNTLRTTKPLADLASRKGTWVLLELAGGARKKGLVRSLEMPMSQVERKELIQCAELLKELLKEAEKSQEEQENSCQQQVMQNRDIRVAGDQTPGARSAEVSLL